jgi:hypothetical protein
VKLKDIFLRQRVSREERPFWPVLESKGKIIWTRGLGNLADLRSAPDPVECRLLLIDEERVPRPE